MENLAGLSQLARVAATSQPHWQRLFEALRASIPAVDRICAALQVDRYTAYLPRVAQVPELDPLLGREGLFADRETSRVFEVLAEGEPYLVTEQDWNRHPDLAFYKVAVRSNLKFPVSLGGYPTVLNLWSRRPDAFDAGHIEALAPVAAELSRSPFRFDPVPVGLALRGLKELLETRARALAA
jgi:hypothetical protein